MRRVGEAHPWVRRRCAGPAATHGSGGSGGGSGSGSGCALQRPLTHPQGEVANAGSLQESGEVLDDGQGGDGLVMELRKLQGIYCTEDRLLQLLPARYADWWGMRAGVDWPAAGARLFLPPARPPACLLRALPPHLVTPTSAVTRFS